MFKNKSTKSKIFDLHKRIIEANKSINYLRKNIEDLQNDCYHDDYDFEEVTDLDDKKFICCCECGAILRQVI